MTGTPRSNKYIRPLAVLVLAAGLTPASLVADELKLQGDARLTGTVREIGGDGAVRLETPLAPEPLAIKAGQVSKVTFSRPTDRPLPCTSSVQLTNGDIIPGNVESIDPTNLTLGSSLAGRLVIPRNLTRSLQLGSHLPNLLYSGPDDFGGWQRDAESKTRWTCGGGQFRLQGAGRIQRQFELPERFIVRFQLDWEANPNIRFYFAADPDEGSGPVDRYYLQYNSAGLGIKRESTTGKTWTNVGAPLGCLPQQFPAKHLAIELRVDRTARTMELFLNDEPEGIFKDPSPKAPTGAGIGFQAMTGSQGEIKFSQLEISEWVASGTRRRVENRGDATKDALIGTAAERFSGTLVGTKSAADGILYVFKNAYQEEPIEVPESEVSTLFFAGKKDAAPAPEAAVSYVLLLIGGGSLHVTSCTLSAEGIEAVHPLLGKLTLNRNHVTAFERVQTQPKEPKEPKEPKTSPEAKESQDQ